MSNVTFDLLPFINAVLITPLAPAAMNDATELASLGIDSLATINLLVTIAEHLDADLAAYVDTLEAPRTLGDLRHLAMTFMENNHRIPS